MAVSPDSMLWLQCCDELIIWEFLWSRSNNSHSLDDDAACGAARTLLAMLSAVEPAANVFRCYPDELRNQAICIIVFTSKQQLVLYSFQFFLNIRRMVIVMRKIEYVKVP
jgi:hypothetical protein